MLEAVRSGELAWGDRAKMGAKALPSGSPTHFLQGPKWVLPDVPSGQGALGPRPAVSLQALANCCKEWDTPGGPRASDGLFLSWAVSVPMWAAPPSEPCHLSSNWARLCLPGSKVPARQVRCGAAWRGGVPLPRVGRMALGAPSIPRAWSSPAGEWVDVPWEPLYPLPPRPPTVVLT